MRGPAVLLLTVLAFACRDAQPVGDGAGATERAPADFAQDAAAAAPVEATREDSAIFRTTIEWARQQRLDTLDIGAIVAGVGRRFVGAPYIPKTLDPPGPERLIVNLRTFDCVTYVESMLAFARVIRAGEDDFSAFTRELRRIRYRDDGSQYADRLHYFSEWIAANEAKGLVRNRTAALGGEPDTTRIDFMSTHADLYHQLADSANLRAILETEARLAAMPRWYIPESRIAAIANQIHDGDIIAATSTVPGLDVAHTGIAIHIDGQLHLMHAPLVGSVVEISDVPLAQRIQRIGGQDGIMVARPL